MEPKTGATFTSMAGSEVTTVGKPVGDWKKSVVASGGPIVRTGNGLHDAVFPAFLEVGQGLR